MRITILFAMAVGVAIGLAGSRLVTPPEARSQESKAEQPADPVFEQIEASAQAFEQAFNKGDADAMAALFAENGEIVDEDENVVTGRDKIRARFVDLFKKYPKATMSVQVTSFKQLSPDVAIEEGLCATSLEPDEAGSFSPYSVVHLKKNGKWQIATVRDFPEETAITAHDQLLPLEWLVGDWVDQTEDSKVQTSCQWTEDGNYLLQEFTVKLRGGMESRGTQRIGWDPVRNTIRSWAFDHSGGYGEATWTPVDGGWVIKTQGFTPDGREASATRIITPLGADLFELHSVQQLVGVEFLPDSHVRVARRPPPPVAP